MNILTKIILLIIILLGFVYFGQAQKAKRVNELRIETRFEKGGISKAEYDNLKKQNTLARTLLSPKEVIGVD